MLLIGLSQNGPEKLSVETLARQELSSKYGN